MKLSNNTSSCYKLPTDVLKILKILLLAQGKCVFLCIEHWKKKTNGVAEKVKLVEAKVTKHVLFISLHFH